MLRPMPSKSRFFAAVPADFLAPPDRRVAVDRRGAVVAAVGVIGILTIVATTMGGCDSAPVSHGSGGQSGNGEGGRTAGGGAGGQAGAGGGVAGADGGTAGAGGSKAGAGGGQAGAGGGVAGAGGRGGVGAGGKGGAGAGGSGPAVIWSSDATKAVVEDTGGGFVAPPPTGSECGYGVGAYTFTVADDKLVWHVCDTNQTPFKYVDGARVLNAGERMMLVDALESVVIATRTLCGADKSIRLLTVTRPSGPVTYRDSFYSCQGQGIYVDGIDAVFSVAGKLAK